MTVADTPKTIEDLVVEIEALVAFGHNDYNEAADALWKAALLAFNYAAHQVGATGFQAGFAALKFYGEALHIDGPFGIVKAENALYPQYDEVAKVRDWVETGWRPWLIEQATAKAAGDNTFASPRVLAHWRALAAEAVTS
jgi:hypothetical protein